jgi:hypothetical protein
MKWRVVAVLVVAAVLVSQLKRDTAPQPAPMPPDAFSLAGLFQGEDAAEAAATLAALADELADEIEHDGMQDEPFLKTGTALDTLRNRARSLRCRGRSIGDEHPRVREAVAAYLDDAVGTSGGPVTDEQRSRWVKAYRSIARAAERAIR